MKKILNVLLVIAIIFSAVWSAPLAHAFEADDKETPIRPEPEWMMVAPRFTTLLFPNTQVHVAPTADPAYFRNIFPFLNNHIWATNPVLVTDFGHVSYLNWNSPAPVERMSYRVGLGRSITDEVTLHEGEADTIDFFNVARPEGFYLIHINGHHVGSPNMDTGYVFVNIQRTSSFVNIDGVSMTQDSSLCPTLEGTIDPDTGELVRCESAVLPAPVINPSVITVGRPAHDVHGEYTVTWTIVDEEDGELVAEGTGTAPINVHTHPGLRDRLALDRTYTITVTVTETTPDGFPHDAGIVSQSIGRFEIVPTYVYVFHVDEYAE